MWENRSRTMYLSCMLIAGTLLVQIGFYAVHVLFHWNIHMNLIDVCVRLLHDLGLPVIGFILNLVVFSTVFLLVWLALSQFWLSHRASRKLIALREPALSQLLNHTYCNGKDVIIAISHPAPAAFTMGLFRARIVLSTGMIQLLDKQELTAVIQHEMFHKLKGDPGKTFVLGLFASSMWYIPALRCFRKQYRIIREVLADRYAISQTGSPVHLGSAMLKMLRLEKQRTLAFSHVSFADTSINYRMKQLLEPETELALAYPWRSVLCSTPILLLLAAMFLIVFS
ncbi:M56 family peptidase [Brevibacillus fluminis]|uniref:M56 family peptidase n=1 Tax=Brevibacillus fluminis TaxID=511487 RepID=A0A3M8DQS4_9BACL|nr:M56 family metallopeptidase [Brevibacillus fluminis]RNB90486.1 M56 family peptidase [Brevibacillus fluminis]